MNERKFVLMFRFLFKVLILDKKITAPLFEKLL